MKILSKHQAVEKKISIGCTVFEYKLNHELIDGAVANICGRYPEVRRVVNYQCAELAHVIGGQGKVVVNDKEYNVNLGDVILIDAGEKYYWEGEMQLFLSCRPAWNPEQHQTVD